MHVTELGAKHPISDAPAVASDRSLMPDVLGLGSDHATIPKVLKHDVLPLFWGSQLPWSTNHLRGFT